MQEICHHAVRNLWARLLPILAGLVLIAGCATRLAYDNVDRLVHWYVSDFISMDSAQRARFDDEFAVLWQWHRASELPRYAALLDEARLALLDGADAAEIDRLVDAAIAGLLELEQRALPVAISLLTSLTDKQVVALRAQLDDNNRELIAGDAAESPAATG